VNYPGPAGASTAVLGDFNSDGHVDIAVESNTNAVLAVLFGKANGTFQTAVDYVGVSGPVAMASGDFNDDGTTDLVSVTTASQAEVQLNECL